MTVTKRRPSMFRQLIRGAATRIAADPSIPPENREALAQHAEHIIWQQSVSYTHLTLPTIYSV